MVIANFSRLENVFDNTFIVIETHFIYIIILHDWRIDPLVSSNVDV